MPRREKRDASSPTISIEAVFLIVTIAAMKGCVVMTMDITGAFLQMQLKGEQVHVSVEGRMAQLLTFIDPKPLPAEYHHGEGEPCSSRGVTARVV